LRAFMSVWIVASRSGFAYGSGRNSTALTTLKIAVVAPIPSPMVAIAVTVKAGLFLSVRTANARSREIICGVRGGLLGAERKCGGRESSLDHRIGRTGSRAHHLIVREALT